MRRTLLLGAALAAIPLAAVAQEQAAPAAPTTPEEFHACARGEDGPGPAARSRR